MENRDCKNRFEEFVCGIIAGIGFGFLILVFIIGIFSYGFGFEIEICKSNPKIESEIQDSGHVKGDDVEALGYAGNWDGNMVEYSWPRFFNLSDAERKTIQYIVAGEAKGEPMEGKMAVAQCILNGMVKSDWTAEKVRIEYQYSGWDDELEKSNPEAWAEVVEAVSRVFDDGELISDKPILYFYAPKHSSGKWHETLEFSFELSGHRFFYLKEDESADWFLNLRKDV